MIDIVELYASGVILFIGYQLITFGDTHGPYRTLRNIRNRHDNNYTRRIPHL